MASTKIVNPEPERKALGGAAKVSKKPLWLCVIYCLYNIFALCGIHKQLSSAEELSWLVLVSLSLNLASGLISALQYVPVNSTV